MRCGFEFGDRAPGNCYIQISEQFSKFIQMRMHAVGVIIGIDDSDDQGAFDPLACFLGYFDHNKKSLSFL